MKRKTKYSVIVSLLCVMFSMSLSSYAERIRLDRKHGTVNQALQTMLVEQVSVFGGGVGKLEFGRGNDSRGDCTADLFVSPDTIFTVVESRKAKARAEFYVDHPKDSFKNVLFQALTKQGNQSSLSVDKKTGGYKFISNGKKLTIEVKEQSKLIQCEFELSKVVLIAGETE